MQVRLAFSAAAILDVPDVLLIDEVLAVGDIQFIGKCFNLIEEIREKASIILVSHSIANIRRFCNRCCLLEKGKITLDSNNVNDVIGTYVARSASDPCSKDDAVFLNGNSRVKRIEGQTKPRQALKLKFKNEANAVYAEIVLKKTGNENVLAFYEILEEKLPVVRLKGLDWEEVGIDLRDLPSGNYSFTLSLLDTNLRYLSRRNERCCFCIVNEFESFSPVLRKVPQFCNQNLNCNALFLHEPRIGFRNFKPLQNSSHWLGGTWTLGRSHALPLRSFGKQRIPKRRDTHNSDRFHYSEMDDLQVLGPLLKGYSILRMVSFP